jgi:hypothetical protein
MAAKPVAVICILVVCLVTCSCKKLEAPTPTGPLTYETLKFTDAIPAEYGSLTAVTGNSQNPWVCLWFQKSDGSITAVFVNPVDGKLGDRAMSIRRK